MDIGRKIYYDKATGDVLQDCGVRMGSVIATTQTQDFRAYTALQPYLQSAVDFIQLAYGERSAEFTDMGSMHVDPATKALTIYPRLTISTDKTQITVNGTDTATITVTVQATINSHAISFTVNSGPPVTINTSNGAAKLPITTTIPGDYVITATSDLYGANSVIVKGV